MRLEREIREAYIDNRMKLYVIENQGMMTPQLEMELEEQLDQEVSSLLSVYRLTTNQDGKALDVENMSDEDLLKYLD